MATAWTYNAPNDRWERPGWIVVSTGDRWMAGCESLDYRKAYGLDSSAWLRLADGAVRHWDTAGEAMRHVDKLQLAFRELARLRGLRAARLAEQQQ